MCVYVQFRDTLVTFICTYIQIICMLYACFSAKIFLSSAFHLCKGCYLMKRINHHSYCGKFRF